MGVIRSKNLAMPDLTGKTEIEPGIYRMSQQVGITLDYNSLTGDFIINGLSTGGFGIRITKNFIINGSYTYSLLYVSGSFDGIFTSQFYSATTPPYDLFNLVVTNNINYQSTQNINNALGFVNIYISPNTQYDNYKLRLQLEQGDAATPYTKPFISLSTKQVRHYVESKNLAMPNLTGKPEISAGIYRLSTSYGLTWDYNVYTSEYIVNGTSTQQGSINLTHFTEPSTYTLSFHYVSGSMSTSNVGLVASMPPPDIGGTYVYVSGSTNTGETKTYTHSSLFYLNLITWFAGIIYNNYTFKLQLEKGSTATDYEVPFTPYFAKTKKIIIPSKNLALPDLTDKTEFNLDQSIAELNGYTLREVFETSNQEQNIYNSNYWQTDTPYNTISYNVDYLNVVQTQNFPYLNTNRLQNSSYILPQGHKAYVALDVLIAPNSPNAAFNFYTSADFGNVVSLTYFNNKTRSNTYTANLNINSNLFVWTYRENSGQLLNQTFRANNYIFINMTTLGIQSLTKEQMDYWYNVYQSLANGERVYSLYNYMGITLDYNVNNGIYEMNGTASINSSIDIMPLQQYSNLTYTSTLYILSGSYDGSLWFKVSTSRDWVSYMQNQIFHYDGMNKKSITSILPNSIKPMILYNTGYTYNNLQFKLQLELGNTATDYEKPRNTITYNPDFNMEVTNND